MNRSLAVFAVAVAAVAATTALSAQAIGRDSNACYFDTTSFQITRSFSIGLAPGWRVSRLGAGKPVPTFYLLVAQVIRQYYRVPHSMGLPFWARTMMLRTSDTLDTIGQGFDGTVYFRLSETGQLADSTIQVTTASPELNASIVDAVRRADSAAAFPPPDGDVQRDNGRVVLRTVDLEQSKSPSVGLVRASVSLLGVDRPAEFQSPPKIAYPDEAIGNGVGDNITIQFVVDERGRVDPASMRILQGDYREFAQATLLALTGTKFTPAQVAGCAVPELVEFQVRFRGGVRCRVAGPC